MSTQAEESPQNLTLTEGQIFEGRYQILSVLGRGGVGVVYKARHMHMDKLVAIKTLLQSVVSDDAESFQRFEREARTASNLDHPNIIRIFDFDKSASGLVFLVMEYLGDRTLEILLIEKGRLDVEQFLPIASQICDGLQNAHKHQVIHRDIKPSNIMLLKAGDEEECVKIVDFGLAKLSTQEAAQSLTQTGTIIGTPLFMSPEQCRGLTLDSRSDIYSLGCVFYLALTGRVPIQGATALDTLFQHTAVRPKSFADIGLESLLPPRLEAVIFKSLEKEPEMRHQSMLEFRTELQKAIFDPSFRPASGGGGTEMSSMPQAQVVTAEDARSSKYSDLVDSTHTVVSISKSPKSMRQLRGAETVANQPPLPEPEKIGTVNKPAIIASTIAAMAVAVAAVTLFNRPAPTPAPVTPQANPVAAPVDTPMAKSAAKPVTTARSMPATSKPKTVVEQKEPRSERKIPVASVAKLPEPVKDSPPQKTTSADPEIVQLHDLLTSGRDAMNQKNFGEAERCFDLSLRLQTKKFGSRNYRLFPTLTSLMHCQMMQQERDRTRPNLMVALDIFNRDQKTVLDDVSAKPKAAYIWKTMASVSRLNANETRDMALLKWSADFYELACSAWKGPRHGSDGDEYQRLCGDYWHVLLECGNRGKAAQVLKELDVKPDAEMSPKTFHPLPDRNRQRESIQRNGKMLIHTYRY